MESYQTFLNGMLANPDQQISTLPLLTDCQVTQQVVEWNNTRRNYPRDVTLPQLFEQQVERSPDAVAVVFEDHQVTYRELNGRANQLAHYLRRHGVGPETRVGVCLERSVELIVSLVAIGIALMLITFGASLLVVGVDWGAALQGLLVPWLPGGGAGRRVLAGRLAGTIGGDVRRW